jgi:uncharacterized protein
MELDGTFFAVAIPAVLIAAISKRGFGSGVGFVSAPLLALVLEPRQAIGLMLPLLMLMDAAGLRPYWRKWSWPQTRLLMIGMVPGAALGWLFFRTVSTDGVRLLVGGIAIGFVAFQIARDRGWLRPPEQTVGPSVGLFWGTAAGFTSFVSHAGGPLASMYLLGERLDKTRYQASTVLTFWWGNSSSSRPTWPSACSPRTRSGRSCCLRLSPWAVSRWASGRTGRSRRRRSSG